MLHSYISNKDVQKEASSVVLRPILIGFGIIFGLLVIGGLIVVALIPLYIPNRSVAPPPLNGIFEYNFTFILEEDIDFPVGPLNAATLEVVQTHIRSLLAASNSQILHNGELNLLAASIKSVSRSTRKKRAIRDSIAVMTDENDIPEGRQALAATIQFVPNVIIIVNLRELILQALVSLYLIIPLPVPLLIIIIGLLTTSTTTTTTTSTTSTTTTTSIASTVTTIITTTSITSTVTTTTTTTTACTDTIGYFETGTGHTCQTYDDYGFCSDGEINEEMPPAEPEEAISNCCICGKS